MPKPLLTIEQYKTDFMLMHRAMRDRLPGFQGTKDELQSMTHARGEVGANIALLKSRDQAIKEAVILQYLLSREAFKERKLFRKDKHMSKLITQIRDDHRFKLKQQGLIDNIIRTAEEEIANPGATRDQISQMRIAAGGHSLGLLDVQLSSFYLAVELLVTHTGCSIA